MGFAFCICLLGIFLLFDGFVFCFGIGIIQVVGESGLFTPDDIAFVKEAGVRAVCFLCPSMFDFVCLTGATITCTLAETRCCLSTGLGWRINCETE